MADDGAIIFECPYCAQSIEAPAEMRGMEVDCPGCTRKVKVSNPKAKQINVTPTAKSPIANWPSLVVWIMLAFGAVAIYLQNQQLNAISLLVKNSERHSVKWEYMVKEYNDDSKEMEEYNRTHPSPDTEGLDFSGEFGLLKIHPDSSTEEGSTWEICGCFVEPKPRPCLVLIFKRPAN